MKKTENMPRTPFSTALSGSAKETELRIRSIFQWKKKRPPVWLMALTAAACPAAPWSPVRPSRQARSW